MWPLWTLKLVISQKVNYKMIVFMLIEIQESYELLKVTSMIFGWAWSKIGMDF